MTHNGSVSFRETSVFRRDNPAFWRRSGSGRFRHELPMMSLDRSTKLRNIVLVLAFGVSSAGCNSLTKLDEYKVAPAPTKTDAGPVCKSNVECTDQATAAEGASDPVA